MTTAAKNFITEIGRVQAVFTGKQPSKQDAFEACVLGPFSTTEHLTRVKESKCIVLEWHEILLACIRGIHKLAPTICARYIFITQVAMYDAWAAYNGKVSAVYSKEKAGKDHDSMEATISFAAFATLSVLFQKARLDESGALQDATAPLNEFLQTKYPSAKAFKVECLTDLEDVIKAALGLDESMLLGLKIARDVLCARMEDGSNQCNLYVDTTNYPHNIFPNVPKDCNAYPNEPLKVKGFEPATGKIVDPNFWQQLDVEGNCPTVQTPATPHWGGVKGFAMKTPTTDGWTTAETDQLLLDGAFPDYEEGKATSGYKTIATEVLAYSAALNDKNKVIADYWADYNHSNLPPGHWCALTVRFMYERKYSTDQAVQLLFALSAALFDASIACWSGKYKFNKPRPITAVNVYPKELECVYTFQKERPIQIIPNENWRPYQPAALISPNFPAYPSGHSTFGAAFVTVMENFTKSTQFKALVMVPKCSLPSDLSYKGAPDAPAINTALYWETFEEASQENGSSRLYNGVHYQPDNVHGMEVGRKVADKVWNAAFSHFEAAYNAPSQSASDGHAQNGVNTGAARKADVNGDIKQNRVKNLAEQFKRESS